MVEVVEVRRKEEIMWREGGKLSGLLVKSRTTKNWEKRKNMWRKDEKSSRVKS